MQGFGFGQRKRSSGLTLKSVSLSACGPHREHNEDCCQASDVEFVYCVADGIGGGCEGEKASQIVCREIRMLNAAEEEYEARLSAVERSLADANAVINDYALRKGYRQMGSTAALLVFDPEDGSHATVIHVGDSRVYRIRGGLATALTRDHSVGFELSDFAGERAEDFRSRENPLTHVLTRAVGVRPEVEWDRQEIDVRAGDRFVLCTDGVHDVISDARLAIFAGGGTLDSARTRLAAEVEKAGAPDNYTFILIDVQ